MVRLILLLFLVIPLFIHGQITITVNDLPVVDESYSLAIDTSVSTLSVGGAGANQFWDFSGLSPVFVNGFNVLDPQEAEGSDDFRDANYVIESEGVYSFFSGTANGNIALGFYSDFMGQGNLVSTQYAPTQTLLEFPTTFGSSFVDDYAYDTQVDASASGAPGDSVRFKRVAISEVAIDGYGQVAVPLGTFNALRQQTVTMSIDSFWVKSLGVWILFSAIADTTTTYQWLTKESKVPLVTMTESSEGAILSASYLESLPSLLGRPSAAFSFAQLEDGSFAFQDESLNSPISWFWEFGDGTTSDLQNPFHTYATVGAFEVCLTATNGAGSDRFCQTVDAVLTNIDDPVLASSSATIYPNPAIDQLIVELSPILYERGHHISVVNSLGQVLQTVAASKTQRLAVSNFAPGVYYLIIQNQAGQRIGAVNRWIKQ